MTSECIRGTCLFMCPDKERWMREREGLLHRFEIDERTQGLKRPKADPEKTVKCYARSAAGQNMTDPSFLRPGPVLLATVRYLLTKVVTRKEDWVMIYDFVFDRLRAVRQDLAIQRIDISTKIQVYEPIVRFHVYSAQRLCERDMSQFDPKINHQHLLECIKELLVLYDEQKRLLRSSEPHINLEMLNISDHREQMEAMYILLHIGEVEGLMRGLQLPAELRKSRDVQTAIKISFAWYLGNYVRVTRLIENLTPLLVCAVMCNLRNLRKGALRIMSSAYNSKALTFPGLKLQTILLYKDIKKLKEDCERFCLPFVNENVMFQKTKFNENAVPCSEAYYRSETMEKFLPKILLET